MISSSMMINEIQSELIVELNSNVLEGVVMIMSLAAGMRDGALINLCHDIITNNNQ